MERCRSVRHERILKDSLMSGVNSFSLSSPPPPFPSILSLYHLKVSLLFAFSNYQGVTAGFHNPPFSSLPPSNIMLTILNLKKTKKSFSFVCQENYS